MTSDKQHTREVGGATSDSITRAGSLLLLVACCLLLGVGCESLQRKFTRKPSQVKPFTPIIQFQDYTRSMTPLDRYRKHSMLFDYWNGDLLETLQGTTFNAKRLRHASAESLAELRTLHGLLGDDLAPQLAPVIEERAGIDARVQRGVVDPLQAPAVIRQLEAQTRRLHRDFYWRDVEDHLKPLEAGPAADATPH